MAHLNARERIVQLSGDRSHVFHTAREDDLFSVIIDLSDRRDDGCRAAQSAFGKIAHFIEIYLAFFDFETEIILRHSHEGAAGDGRKNTVRFRRDDFIVLCDEDKVGSAGLFDFRASGGVEIHIFIKSFGMSRNDGVKAHGVIETCFDMSCAVRSRPVKIADFNSQRLDAALEIRAYRSRKHTELIFIGRLYTDDSIRTEDVRTDIQRGAGTVRRYVSGVGSYDAIDGVEKFFLRINGNLEASCGILQTLRIEIRTECDNSARLLWYRL